MKTVITSTGDNLDARFDLRFGRAAWFCIYDDATRESSFVANIHKDAQGGAGVKTSEMLIDLGVTKAISGDFGPKAKELLQKFNVQMVILQDGDKSVKHILESIQ